MAQAVWAITGDFQVYRGVITDGLNSFQVQPGHGESIG
jgi:hypothetical protein